MYIGPDAKLDTLSTQYADPHISWKIRDLPQLLYSEV